MAGALPPPPDGAAAAKEEWQRLPKEMLQKVVDKDGVWSRSIRSGGKGLGGPALTTPPLPRI